MSRAPGDPVAAFLRGASKGWIDGRLPYEDLHLCDEEGQVGIVLTGPAWAFDEDVQEGPGPIAGESMPVSTAIVTVAEMGTAPYRAGWKAVKELRAQNAARPKEPIHE